MQKNDITLIRDFHHRYKKISDTSGYAFVYDTIALIREFIPCKEIGISTANPKDEYAQKPELGAVPLWVATPLIGRTQNLFWGLFKHNDFANRYAADVISKMLAGEPVDPRSFTDDPRYARGITHQFYKLVDVSDVVMIAGLVDRHQFIQSPFTQSCYVAYSIIARDKGQIFDDREKQLFALFFGVFLEDFRKKISRPENSRFLPYLTGEKVDEKTKIEAIFSSGAKFKPRELATIKACFDLKQNQQKVTRATVANYLHLHDRDDYSALELKKALDKVDYDIKKIKDQISRNFNHDALSNDNSLQEFELEHITDVFKTYAYFGLYPHIPNGNERFISYLSTRLDKYR